MEKSSWSVPNFAAALKKPAMLQATELQFERNGRADFILGTRQGLSQGPKVQQGPITWLETGTLFVSFLRNVVFKEVC